MTRDDILDYNEPHHPDSRKYYHRSDRFFRYAMYVLILTITFFRFFLPHIESPVSPTVIYAVVLVAYVFVVICSVLTIFFGIKSFLHHEAGSLNRIMILLISSGILFAAFRLPFLYL